MALPTDHHLAKSCTRIRPRSLAGEAFVVPEQDRGLREVARRGKFTPHISAVPGTLLTVLTHVSLGAGVAVVPSVLPQVVGLPNVVFRDIAGPAIASEVAAVYRRYERSPTVKHLTNQIVETVPVHY